MTSTNEPAHNASTTNQAYEEAMDDVHTRFILNLPDEELQSAPRIFFQLEQAWWFYDDFICDGAAAAAAAKNTNEEEKLPRFKHVKPFSLAMFKSSPLLQPMLPQFEKMYGEFTTYKRSISTYGTILLNADATKVALCRVYKGKAWTLPGGKVNQNESGKLAAARETYEETGFDPQSELGLCATWKEQRINGEFVEELDGEVTTQLPTTADNNNDGDLPWKSLQDTDKLVYTENDTNKRRTCYVCRGIPESFPFEPVARKEISEVSWHEITNLPKTTYAVLPFVAQLRKWIKRDNRKRGIRDGDKSRSGSRPQSRPKQQHCGGGKKGPPQSTPMKILQKDDEFGLTPFFSDEGNFTLDESAGGAGGGDGGGAGDDVDVFVDEEEPQEKKKKKRDKSTGKNKNQSNSKQRANSRSSNRSGSRPNSRGRAVTASDNLVKSALASPGESNRWTEDEMFATNEQILGRKITYDGNPHDFAEKGFDVDGTGRVDPHAFRMVGGTFMNSEAGAGNQLSAPPEASALQPLVRRARAESTVSGLSGDHSAEGGPGLNQFNEDDNDGLTPFFSDDGRAPWEEGGALGGIIGADAAAKSPHITPPPVRSEQSNSKGLALLNRLRQGTSANDEVVEEVASAPIQNTNREASNDVGREDYRTIFIRNLPEKTTEYEVRALFEPILTRSGHSIVDVSLNTTRWFCFVDMDSPDAVAVIEKEAGDSLVKDPRTGRHVESSFMLQGRVLDVMPKKTKTKKSKDDNKKKVKVSTNKSAIQATKDTSLDDMFLTDREITARSQKEKLTILPGDLPKPTAYDEMISEKEKTLKAIPKHQVALAEELISNEFLHEYLLSPRPKRGAGAYIQFLIDACDRVLVVGEDSQVWWLSSGRIAKKETEGVTWVWALDEQSWNKNQHLVYLKRWAHQPPLPGPSKLFGDFRLDANAVMDAMATTATLS